MRLSEIKLAHVIEPEGKPPLIVVMDEMTGEEVVFDRDELWKFVQFARQNNLLGGGI